MSLASLKVQLSTGNGGLDYEHRKLVEAMEAICDRFEHLAASEAIAEGLGVLHAAASAHFALEEMIMRKRKYAGYEAHKADHEQLLDQLRAMMEAAEAGQCEACRMGLRSCLESWFSGHVTKADAGLRSLA